MIGQTLSHYKILEKLGAGAMGEVYRAEDSTLKREIALKILPVDLASNQERLDRFQREAQTLAALDHPNIVTIHTVEEAEGVRFLTMQLVRGQPLSKLIPKGGMPLERIFEVGIPLADALAAAHEKGVIHRDLKPSNIMVTADGSVKVLDFGLAKLHQPDTAVATTQLSTEPLTEEGRVLGTVPYMSPEQLEGKALDSRSDIFSLGVTLHEMATGERPFAGDTSASLISSIIKDTPREVDTLRRDLPHHLGRIVHHCLEKKPSDRLQSALDVRNELRTLRREVVSGSLEPSTGTAVPLPRRPGIWWSAATIVGLVLAVLVWLVVRSERPPPLLGFEQRDWVLMAGCASSEDDSGLAQALSLAFTIGLEESGYVNVVSRPRIENILQRMRRPADSTVDQTLGREICQRAGIKALLVPELERVGERYLLTLVVVAPTTGESVASFSEQATSEGALLDAVEVLIERLRRGLGESLPALLGESGRLATVTTGSMQALVVFSQGQRAWYEGRYQAAVEHFEEAVKIDPEFASAYAALGNAYDSYLFNERERAERNFEQALAHLDRVGERERYFIQARYHGHFGRSEQAIHYLQLHLERYPDDQAARFNLGGTFREVGDCERAIREYEEVLRVDPSHAGALINIATCMNRRESKRALSFYDRAFEIRPEWKTSGNLNHEYGMTLLLAGETTTARQVFEERLEQPIADERAAAHRSLGQLALFVGRFNEAAQHFEQAVILHQNTPASAGRDRLFWALGEAARGRASRAVELLLEAERVIPLDLSWIWLRAQVGLGYLEVGSPAHARRLAAELEGWAREQPQERAGDLLHRRQILAASVQVIDGEVAAAIASLEALREIENRDNSDLSMALAQAYLAAGQDSEAEQMLLQVIDASWIYYEGLVPWVQAHLKLARLYRELGREAEALRYFTRYAEIWGGADSPLPEFEPQKQRQRFGE